MKFEFQLTREEQTRLDNLNRLQPHPLSHMILFGIACVAPSVIIFVTLGTWPIAVIFVVIVTMATFQSFRTRKQEQTEPAQQWFIELSDIGKRERVGNSETILKWNAIDDVLETSDEFLFERLQRYSMLPKRLFANDEAVNRFREFIATSRNYPAAANTPLPDYTARFGNDAVTTWHYSFEHGDFSRQALQNLQRVGQRRFSDQELERLMRPGRSNAIVFGLIGLATIGMIGLLAAQRQPVDQSALLTVVAMVWPFVGAWIVVHMFRWFSHDDAFPVPREPYSLRLFDDGWATGHPDAMAWHRWNQETQFFLSRQFLGLRTDRRRVNLIPTRAFNGTADIRSFLHLATETCRQWVKQNQHISKSTPVDPRPPVETGNPYQSPRL